MEWNAVKIAIYTLNGLIILITFYLIFLYIKSDTFKIYPCYNIMILSFIILFDNIFRIIPIYDITAFQYAQAYILTLFDKLILTTITSQLIIIYFGLCHTRFYFNNEKKIYISTLFIGITISAIISLVYILYSIGDLANYVDYYYCKDTKVKRITDIIFNFILLLVNVSLALLSLGYIATKKKDASNGIIEDLNYGHHFIKIIFMLLFNSLLFVESYLIIFDKFPIDNVDLIYLITCLIILLFNTINKVIIKETIKMFCKKYYIKKYPNYKRKSNYSITDEDDDEDNELKKDINNTISDF